MYSLRLIRSAEKELQKITGYSVQNWGRSRAEKTVLEFEQLFSQIALFPNAGVPSEEPGVQQKAMSKLPFVILYQVHDESEKVTVVQIVHMSRL